MKSDGELISLGPFGILAGVKEAEGLLDQLLMGLRLGTEV